jgi:ribonuclease-3
VGDRLYAYKLEIMRGAIVKNEIEACLDYKFHNPKLLERALTRKAFANEQGQRGIASVDQEIFCTLGDAVLKTVLIDLLIRNGVTTPDMITRRKIELEREENLATIGRKIQIGPFIRLGKGEEKHNAGEQPYVLAETLEAIIGAIFLDGGYSIAEDRIKDWFNGLY